MDESVFGKTVKDKISGFTGTVTGGSSYITGCVQLLVQPRLKEDGSFNDARWFDEDRLEILGSKAVTLTVSKVGSDTPAMVK